MKQLLLCIFTLLTTLNLFSQAPANDDCANSVAIMLDEVVDFSTVEATMDGLSVTCFGDNDSIPGDVWFTWTATLTGEVKWSNCSTADFDSRMAVYNAGVGCTPADADVLGCNDDGANCEASTSELIFPCLMGETYLLRMGGYADEATPATFGTGTVVLTETNAPANNYCVNAEVVMNGLGQAFTTVDASTDGPEHPDNPCFGFGSLVANADIWYTYTPDFTGSVLWSTCNTGGFDTRLAVYGPDLPNCPPLDEDLYSCNDDGPDCSGYTSYLIFDVEEGMTYTLRLGGFGADFGSGTFDLEEIIPPTPPANDECPNSEETMVITPEVADAFGFITNGTTIAGYFDTEDYLYPPCLGNQDGGEFSDVWYHFNTLGNTELQVRFFNFSQNENSVFYLDMFTTCDSQVDTVVVMNSCLSVDFDNMNAFGDVAGLPDEPTDLLIRVSTRLTSDSPGEFAFQIVGAVMDNVEDVFAANGVNFFPNPASTQATLEMNLERASDLTYSMLNALGQTVQTQNLGRLPVGNHQLEVQLDALQAGIYFLTIHSENEQKTVRFVKQ